MYKTKPPQRTLWTVRLTNAIRENHQQMEIRCWCLFTKAEDLGLYMQVEDIFLLHACTLTSSFCILFSNTLWYNYMSIKKITSKVRLAPEFLELLCELGEFCKHTIKDRSVSGRLAGMKKGFCYNTDATPSTSHSSVQNKQFLVIAKSRDCCCLGLADFTTYDKGENFEAAKDTNCF